MFYIKSTVALAFQVIFITSYALLDFDSGKFHFVVDNQRCQWRHLQLLRCNAPWWSCLFIDHGWIVELTAFIHHLVNLSFHSWIDFANNCIHDKQCNKPITSFTNCKIDLKPGTKTCRVCHIDWKTINKKTASLQMFAHV